MGCAAGVRCVQAGGNKEKQREQSKKIERNQAKAAQKGGGKAGKNKGMMVDDDSTEASAKPRKWNDYSVAFTFPDPPAVNDTQLLQLIDAHFKYPTREDFQMHDMNVGIGMGSRVRRRVCDATVSEGALCCCGVWMWCVRAGSRSCRAAPPLGRSGLMRAVPCRANVGAAAWSCAGESAECLG